MFLTFYIFFFAHESVIDCAPLVCPYVAYTRYPVYVVLGEYFEHQALLMTLQEMRLLEICELTELVPPNHLRYLTSKS